MTREDHHQEHAEPDPAEAQLLHRAHAARVDLAADREPGLDLLLHGRDHVAVDGRPRLDERVLGAVEIELRLADLHAGVIGLEQDRAGLLASRR